MSISSYYPISDKGIVPIFVQPCIPNACDGDWQVENAQYVC